MKRITMRTLMAGPEGVVQAGATVEVSDERAADLIAANFAEEATNKPAEDATVKPRETAVVKPTGRAAAVKK